MLQEVTKNILKLFYDIGIGLIVVIVVGVVSLSLLISTSTNTLNYAIQYLNIPTPIWATIVLILAVYIYFHTRLKKYHSLSNLQNQNNNVEYNRKLVTEWRNMIRLVAIQLDNSNESVAYLLERNKHYYSLKPHLSQNTIKQITSNSIFISGTTIPSPLQYVLRDIESFEKNKGLI